MNSVLDDGVVGLVLAVSVIYAAYSLGPRGWRPRLLAAAAGLLKPLPKFVGLQPAAQRLAAAAASKSKGACGGCDNCGSEAAPTAPAASTDVSIPLSKIGKRPS